MQKAIENFGFVQCVNVGTIDYLKNNWTKYFLLFGNFCEKNCSSTVFVDFATAGRHRGLSTIYIKHNLLHQNKLRRNVELQNTYIVLFESSCDVMQVSTLNAQLDHWSKLVDWFREATSVTYGQSLIDLSRVQTKDYVIVEAVHPFIKFLHPGLFKSFKIFGRRTHNFSLISECFNCCPANSNVFTSVFSKRVSPLSLQTSGTWCLPFNYRYCGSHEHALSRKIKSRRKICRSQSISKDAKSWVSSRKRIIPSCIPYYALGLHFRKQSWQWLWIIVQRKGASQASVCLWRFPLTFSHDMHRLVWVQYSWRQKFYCCNSFPYLQAKNWVH